MFYSKTRVYLDVAAMPFNYVQALFRAKHVNKAENLLHTPLGVFYMYRLDLATDTRVFIA